MEALTYRLATVEDIPVIAELRKKQIIEEGAIANHRMEDTLVEYFQKALQDGSFLQIVAECGDEIAATGAVAFHQFVPSFSTPLGIKGGITNIYTRPEFRRRGLATEIVKRLLELSKERGVVDHWLVASPEAVGAYEKAGFREAAHFMKVSVAP